MRIFNTNKVLGFRKLTSHIVIRVLHNAKFEPCMHENSSAMVREK